MEKKQAHQRECLITYGCMALWVALSAGVILLNKYILAPELGGFPFPLTLTTVHMAVCSVLSWALVRLQLVEAQDVPAHAYIKCVVPIGVLFAITLWMGNSAYVYLSVSFIQMLKALMPMLVYVTGTLLGTERWCQRTSLVLCVVVGGVLTASHGEIRFVPAGVVMQCASLCSEALRLCLVQLLLQARGFRLNPVSTMYHVSPVCFMALVLPFAVLEAEKVLTHSWRVGPGLLLGSAVAAFALNCSIFLLIGRTSALTLNIAGVVKDVVLVWCSTTLYGSIVTPLQMGGYAAALCGVVSYNLSKLQQQQQAAATAAPHDDEQQLLDNCPSTPPGVSCARRHGTPGGAGDPLRVKVPPAGTPRGSLERPEQQQH